MNTQKYIHIDSQIASVKVNRHLIKEISIDSNISKCTDRRT